MHLTTPRLTLRPFVAGDAAIVHLLCGDVAVADTTRNIPHPYPDGAAQAWIATHAAQRAAGTGLTLAITNRQSGWVIGAISLDIHRDDDRAELGYWIGRPWWGQGFATEAAQAVIAYAFRDLGLNRIVARHLTRNPASGRVMVKSGLRFVGTLHQDVKKWGLYEDVELYAAVRGEWLARGLGQPLGPQGQVGSTAS